MKIGRNIISKIVNGIKFTDINIVEEKFKKSKSIVSTINTPIVNKTETIIISP